MAVWRLNPITHAMLPGRPSDSKEAKNDTQGVIKHANGIISY